MVLGKLDMIVIFLFFLSFFSSLYGMKSVIPHILKRREKSFLSAIAKEFYKNSFIKICFMKPWLPSAKKFSPRT